MKLTTGQKLGIVGLVLALIWRAKATADAERYRQIAGRYTQ